MDTSKYSQVYSADQLPILTRPGSKNLGRNSVGPFDDLAHKGDWTNCDFFCIWGISHALDTDQAVLCIYEGNLGQPGTGGKVHDKWLQQHLHSQDTLWSYWGGDNNSVPNVRTLSEHAWSGEPGHIFDHKFKVFHIFVTIFT